MKDRFKQIGIDRIIRLAWLERTSSLVLAGNTQKDIKLMLQDDLRCHFRPEEIIERGSLDKTITILMRVWLRPPKELVELRDAGLDILKQTCKQDRMAVHWGMVTAVYPFWAGVAMQVGRLLKLQGTAVSSQVQRRMREQYGERQTVSRTTQRVIRSFADWGVLSETAFKGTYEKAPAIPVIETKLVAWLIEAVICTRISGPMTLKSLSESATLFPFTLSQISPDELVSLSARLDVIRHSLDEELVILKP